MVVESFYNLIVDKLIFRDQSYAKTWDSSSYLRSMLQIANSTVKAKFFLPHMFTAVILQEKNGISQGFFKK